VRGAEDDTSEIHRVPMPLDTGLDICIILKQR
jgi:hypothetical protein